MSKIGAKGKSTVVWVLMGMLVLGLTGFGIENFSGGTSTVGEVGKSKITADDYQLALRQEMQGFAAQTGRAMTASEAQALGVPQAVLSRLFLGAALEENARQLGVSVGDEAVARELMAVPAFLTADGKFDSARYRAILREQRLSVPEFENQLRNEAARNILQRAVVGGAEAPDTMVARWLSWMLETRDIRWHELTATELKAPVAAPDDAALESWHKANADRFTAPEIRKITYAWVTPDMLEGKVELDEQALRDIYNERLEEFQKPERRMVERLVFPDEEAASAAKARLEKGELTFEQLAGERGLALTDIDLGEVTKAQLGAAGDGVFALTEPGVAGPLPSDLGPALFSMNAILEPVDIPFEEAQAELRGEAGLDRARRQIEDLREGLEDLLAGGASIDELVADSGMEKGQIEWSTETKAEPGSIAGYAAFRSTAAALTKEDFLTPHDLDDGGLFVAQIDDVIPPALIPLDEIRDRVQDDWVASETHRQLLALAEERRVNTVAGTMPEEAPASETPAAPLGQAQPNPVPVPGAAQPEAVTPDATPDPQPASLDWHEEKALARDGFIDGTPQALVTGAFGLAEEGDIDIVDADNRVFLVTLEKVNPVDTESDQAKQISTGITRQLTEGLQSDIFEYYVRTMQKHVDTTVNQSVIDAVNARM